MRGTGRQGDGRGAQYMGAKGRPDDWQASGVDVTLIDEMLRMTVRQRWSRTLGRRRWWSGRP